MQSPMQMFLIRQLSNIGVPQVLPSCRFIICMLIFPRVQQKGKQDQYRRFLIFQVWKWHSLLPSTSHWPDQAHGPTQILGLENADSLCAQHSPMKSLGELRSTKWKQSYHRRGLASLFRLVLFALGYFSSFLGFGVPLVLPISSLSLPHPHNLFILSVPYILSQKTSKVH